MLCQPMYRAPLQRFWAFTFSMCFLGLLAADTVSAQSATMRIEEDWELEVIQPDAAIDAPQVLVTVSPFGPASNYHFELDLNHASYPSYQSGGLQLRAMNDDDCLSQKRLHAGTRLSVSSEVIAWTNVIERQPAGVAFGVANGTSSSWGAFGDATTYVTILGVGEFNYDPMMSFEKSGISYANNRVARLTLRRVRLVDALGTVTEVSVERSKQ